MKCEIITLRLQHSLATGGTSCLTALADTSRGNGSTNSLSRHMTVIQPGISEQYALVVHSQVEGRNPHGDRCGLVLNVTAEYYL